MAIIECVPNISEGRRPEVVTAIVAAVGRVPGARVLDYSSDTSHNRSVLTLAGDAAPLKEAVLALFEAATKAIDLRSHSGEHPRLGAVDVVPFVRSTASRWTSASPSRRTPPRRGSTVPMPIYLYEEADRPRAAQPRGHRRGEFEGLAARWPDRMGA